VRSPPGLAPRREGSRESREGAPPGPPRDDPDPRPAVRPHLEPGEGEDDFAARVGEKAKPSAALVERIEKKRRDLATAEQAEKARSMETMASMAGAAMDVLAASSRKGSRSRSARSARSSASAAWRVRPRRRSRPSRRNWRSWRRRSPLPTPPLREGRGHSDEDRSRHPRRRSRLGELTGRPGDRETGRPERSSFNVTSLLQGAASGRYVSRPPLRAPDRFRARCGRAGARANSLRSDTRAGLIPPGLANSSGSPGVLEVGSRDAPPLPRPAKFQCCVWNASTCSGGKSDRWPSRRV